VKKLLVIAAITAATVTAASAQTHDGWVKSSDLECDVHDCYIVDNYTDAHKRGDVCATFAIPVYDRPNGKIVRALIVDVPVKPDKFRGEFAHVKSDGIGPIVGKFSECG
jgi:hypothetical protein